jgi:hypothetical protein
MTDKARSVRIPTSEDIIIENGSTAYVIPPINEGWYILITGAAHSVLVANVVFTYIYEVLPTDSAMPMMLMDYSRPGVATVPCIQNLIR